MGTIPLTTPPNALGAAAVTPDGTKVYVLDGFRNLVWVISTSTNQVITSIAVAGQPGAVAFTPDGSKAYVTNGTGGTENPGPGNISVIDTAMNTAVATITAVDGPTGVAITPDGSKAYVPNFFSANVSVIATSTDVLVATVPVGQNPDSFGNFIGPIPRTAPVPTLSQEGKIALAILLLGAGVVAACHRRAS